MGYWPDVNKGDPVERPAVLENNLRHMVNALNGFGDNSPKASGSGVVRIQVWNATGATLKAGSPVAFDGTRQMVGNAVPAVKVTDVSKPFGVVVNTLAANGMGDCIVSGPATIPVAGGSGEYAVPIVNGDAFVLSGNGTARILCINGQKAFALLGMVSDIYDGPFAISYDGTTHKVNVKAGYASLNGEWKDVAAAQLDPASGYVCVYSEITDEGTWSEPVVQIATPGKYNYPVGRVTVTGEGEAASVSCMQFRVPVAIIIDAAECPISAIQYEALING